ncbi:MAG: BlaI/MecI/CopY family transcriptional regulator [Cyanobacterium sp. T60_A2020_053]|nr:BlaI/MecI/CopY family transcriptional regulator [Cyanobacterium sp. T60_A2020_053]
MSFLPKYQPEKLSLGFLEQEILEILWEFGTATVKDVHEKILSDPDRELAYASVTTVLNRLTKKGWLKVEKKSRAFYWTPLISESQARAIQSYQQLQSFLAVSNPDLVASFADSLDTDSLEQITAIANRLKEIRQNRKEEK